MKLSDILAISASVLVSLGGGALIVFALSSWLGKVWANRIMADDQAAHARSLEQLRSKLEAERALDLEQLKRQLDVSATTHLRELQDKLAIYRLATDLISEILADFDRMRNERVLPPDAKSRSDAFNRGRMKAYGYMAMLAPQPVMEAYDALIDYCMMVMGGTAVYDWKQMRALILKLLNEVRKDVGIDKSPIEYHGKL
jgi:hypothetical protein